MRPQIVPVGTVARGRLVERGSALSSQIPYPRIYNQT